MKRRWKIIQAIEWFVLGALAVVTLAIQWSDSVNYKACYPSKAEMAADAPEYPKAKSYSPGMVTALAVCTLLGSLLYIITYAVKVGCYAHQERTEDERNAQKHREAYGM